MDINYHLYQYNICEPPFDETAFIKKTLVPYWRKFWHSLLTELKSKEGLREDELYWQNRITYISHRNKIVAIQFIARYPMAQFASSEYAKRYLPTELAANYRKESGYINTLQYLSVDPAYSYRKTGISFASILMDMSKLQQRDMGSRSTITVTRNAVGIHNLARKIGFNECCRFTKHNVAVSIMRANNTQRHPGKVITDVSDYFWKNRNFLNKKECMA